MNARLKLISKQFVFEENKYFKSCHAATILNLNKTDVMIACFGGTREGADDVKIWLTKNSGDVFEEPVRLSYKENIAHWNPVLFRGGNGKENFEIILYFKTGANPKTWQTVSATSYDNGMTWSKISPLVPGDYSGGRGPVKNKPIYISDGTWLAPRSIETDTAWTVEPDRTLDCGHTWNLLKPLDYKPNDTIIKSLTEPKAKGVIQPSLWEQPFGHVHMLMRSTWGKIYRSDSYDYGITWSPAYETDLPNNNSGLDLVKTSDGSIVLCYNNVSGNWAKRTPLTLAYSVDNGENFIDDLILEDDENGEFSYPSIIAVQDVLHIAYTWNRRNIVYAKAEIKTLD